LKKVKDSDQYEEIKKKMEDMNQVAQKIGTAMYQQQQQAGAQPGADAGQAGEKADKKDKDEPVEGEFEEKKDDDSKTDSAQDKK
jgi:molecular chaperone DnaK